MTTSRPSLRFRFIAPLLLLLIASSAAHAGLILTLDDLSLTGSPGDVFTISGSVTNSSSTPTEQLTTLNPGVLSSPVLQIMSLHVPSTLNVDQSYLGNIVTFTILASAAPGVYPTNDFRVSYDSDNGRTFLSNSVNLSVEVLGSSEIPEPATLWLFAGGLTLLGGLRVFARGGDRDAS